MCESRNSLGTRLEIILLIGLDAYKLLYILEFQNEIVSYPDGTRL